MSTNNPITCVDLMVHPGHMTIYIHRGGKVKHYSANARHQSTSQITRSQRFRDFIGRYQQFTRNKIARCALLKTG